MQETQELKKDPGPSIKLTTSISSDLKTPSIKLGVKKDETKEEEVKEKNSADLPKTPFKFEQLRFELDEFRKRYRPHETQHIILSREPQLDPNTFVVSLVLDNPVQEDILNAMRPDLLEHLRTNLKNFSIQLESTITESTQSKKPYTLNEKLQYLMDQNPMVAEFRKRFGLDTDY